MNYLEDIYQMIFSFATFITVDFFLKLLIVRIMRMMITEQISCAFYDDCAVIQANISNYTLELVKFVKWQYNWFSDNVELSFSENRHFKQPGFSQTHKIHNIATLYLHIFAVSFFVCTTRCYYIWNYMSVGIRGLQFKVADFIGLIHF